MLVNGYGFDETPSSMNRKFKDMGSGNGFLGSLIIWAGLTRAFPKIAFRRIIICRDQTTPLDAINTSLDSGQPLVIEIDRSPSSGLQNHWVVIYARQDDDYLMLDPWPQPPDNAPTTLTSRYGYDRPLSEVITAVVWYEPIGQTPPSPVPGEGLYVRVQAAVTAGLRMRSAPMVSADIVTAESAGTRLHCLESDDVALPKIGVMNRWLKVSDPAGLEGYVAAWYVDKEGEPAPSPAPAPEPQPAPTPEPQPAPAPAPEPAPQPAPDSMTIVISQRVGSVGLRLRSQPNTDSSTLTILNAGKELTVLEPADQARPKIGQMNQWLNVSDGSHTGYVAAWYVELKSAGSPTPQPAPETPPVVLTVIVSSRASAGLRMRDQPNTTSNIIKVLMPAVPLVVLESTATAQAKTGVDGQWLNVIEPGGMTGYVAAWFVTK